jgi:predicted nucleic acid binding AN1-type Zn finger protein
MLRRQSSTIGTVPPTKKPLITTPAPKYGPTALYDDCERNGCEANARVSCPTCGGHFCRTHEAHQAHEGVSRS